MKKDLRPWGFFRNLAHSESWHVKTVHIKKGGMLSLQSHERREEHWFVVEGIATTEIDYGNGQLVKNLLSKGESAIVRKNSKHRISAPDGDVVMVEVSLGDFDEKDIVRYEDKYGRG